MWTELNQALRLLTVSGAQVKFLKWEVGTSWDGRYVMSSHSISWLLASETPSKYFLAQSSSKHSLVSQPQHTPLNLWMVIKWFQRCLEYCNSIMQIELLKELTLRNALCKLLCTYLKYHLHRMHHSHQTRGKGWWGEGVGWSLNHLGRLLKNTHTWDLPHPLSLSLWWIQENILA